MNDIVQKINLWYRKNGAAIYFSHLDLMRHFSRTLRRAALRPRLTAGFNPRPRLVFPQALPLGVASQCETVEIEFVEKMPLTEILAALQRADGGVLDLYRIENLPPFKAGKIVAATVYKISGFPLDAPLTKIAAAIMAEAKIIRSRGHNEKRREIDIRPYLAELRATDNHELIARLLHLDNGAGRIDEIAELATEQCNRTEINLTLEKTGVEFHDK